jgi:hypothetical protein
MTQQTLSFSISSLVHEPVNAVYEGFHGFLMWAALWHTGKWLGLDIPELKLLEDLSK